MLIIHSEIAMPTQTMPKPNDFLGTDDDWAQLVQMAKPSVQSETPEQLSNIGTNPKQEEQVNIIQPGQAEFDQPVPVSQPEIDEYEVPANQIDKPENLPLDVPTSIGEEIGKEKIPKEDILPVDDPNSYEDIPTGVSSHGPPSEYQDYLNDQGIKKIVPKENIEQVDPSEMFKEVLPADTPIDERNKHLDIIQKIWFAMSDDRYKLSINYDTLDKPNKPSLNVDRLVVPQNIAFENGTNRFLLYTKPDPKNKSDYGPLDKSNSDGWKSFAIDNIRSAILEE